MAANDGPVPVRTLAHAARLVRDSRALGRYGIAGVDPTLDYPRLLARVREVVDEVRAQSGLRRATRDRLGVTIFEDVGRRALPRPAHARGENGQRVRGSEDRPCTGGYEPPARLPGFELTATHSDAWSLPSVPPSMLVVGGGATGIQVASVFQRFGSRVELFEAGPRILKTEDADVAEAVATAFRSSGIVVREDFGRIDGFERVPGGVRMKFSKDGVAGAAEAALAVMAVGWIADTAALDLATPASRRTRADSSRSMSTSRRRCRTSSPPATSPAR